MSLLDELEETAFRTRLEFFLVVHEIRPSHLARESTISRQHILRVRKGLMEPTRWKIAQIVSALRRITLLDVQASDIFELSIEESGTWWLAKIRDEVADHAASFRARMRSTAALIAEVLQAPPEEWAPRFIGKGVSEAVVRQLVLSAHRVLDRKPEHAIAILDAAELLTRELPALTNPNIRHALRGRTFLDRAFALRELGRFPDAFVMLDRAEEEFQATPYCIHELAQAWYERAATLFKLGRLDEAQKFCQQARSVFVIAGDGRRAAKARMIEGCIFVDRGELAHAREDFRGVLQIFKAFGDHEAFACACLNLGSTEMRLGHLTSARTAFAAAAAGFAKLEMPGEVVRVHWNLAHLVTFHVNVDTGLPMLRRARADFANLKMTADAAFVGLDIVRALFSAALSEAPREAEQLCATIFQEFEQSGATKSALEALAYLRDAMQRREASAQLVEEVRSFVERAPRYPEAAFTPPGRPRLPTPPS